MISIGRRAIDPKELDVLSSKSRWARFPQSPERARLVGELIQQLRDRQIGYLVQTLRRLSPDELVSLLDTRSDMVFSVFAVRMAELAVQQRSRQALNLGLAAAGIGCTITEDFRDVIVALAPLWHSANLLGLNAHDELLAVAHELGGPGGAMLASFANRSPENQSLEAMGYAESQDEEGFRYVPRRWEDDEAASSPGPVRKEVVVPLLRVTNPVDAFWQTVESRRLMGWQVMDRRSEPAWVRLHRVSLWDDDWLDMWIDEDGLYHQRFYKPGVDPTKLSDKWHQGGDR